MARDHAVKGVPFFGYECPFEKVCPTLEEGLRYQFVVAPLPLSLNTAPRPAVREHAEPVSSTVSGPVQWLRRPLWPLVDPMKARTRVAVY